MEEWLKHIPYWILILVLLVILGVKYTAPKITEAVKSVKQISVPSIQVTQYPLMDGGCSRVHLQVIWQ